MGYAGLGAIKGDQRPEIWYMMYVEHTDEGRKSVLCRALYDAGKVRNCLIIQVSSKIMEDIHKRQFRDLSMAKYLDAHQRTCPMVIIEKTLQKCRHGKRKKIATTGPYI